MENATSVFPAQQISFAKKTKEWRKKCVDFGDNNTFFNSGTVRRTVQHKKINYDLLRGKLHMKDLEYILDPDGEDEEFIPENIQHYSIMNSKLDVLKGEESKRLFDFRVVVTNPTAISEIEEQKKSALLADLQSIIEDSQLDEKSYNEKIEELNDYYTYDYQDFREIRANALLNHYMKELNIPAIFNSGFTDAMAVGEEIYMCDIVGGEPTFERVNPNKIRVLRSGYSNRIEDADMIVIEDFWSLGKIIDTYCDVLSDKDRKYLEELAQGFIGENGQDLDNSLDHTTDLISKKYMFLGEEGVIVPDDGSSFDDYPEDSFQHLPPVDSQGNIRVVKVFWKSRRKLKKVKSYDPETGEELETLHTEEYVCNTDLGEEEQILWVNEAWEGTKIGADVYVNMRPRLVQYSRLGNPSKCHFGIIGSIYNLNDGKPFSLVDKMKPYNYQYDVVADRLNNLLSHNIGKLLEMDLSLVPDGWEVEDWMYYVRKNHLVIKNSFNEGKVGAATGKLAGALNNATRGTIDMELGNSIQNYFNIMEQLKQGMSDIVGVSRQREGQISNRETVGGVERATLQSSHITEPLFVIHDDLKKRALECFLETAKIAASNKKNIKFQYILPDHSQRIMEFPGEEFAECDYGLVVDLSQGAQELSQRIETLAQAGLQKGTTRLSTIFKLYGSKSLAEKQRLLEADENKTVRQQQQQQQQQLESAQQIKQMEMQQKQAELDAQIKMNQDNNDTKITVAYIQATSNPQQLDQQASEENKEALLQRIKESREKLSLSQKQFEHTKRMDEARLAFDREKANRELAIKQKQANKNNLTR